MTKLGIIKVSFVIAAAEWHLGIVFRARPWLRLEATALYCL